MRKGLDSIVNQSFKDYELLIVCDACTDNTVQIAKEYIRPDTTDTVFKVNYARAGLARNKGLDYAFGKWVLWMDDDDWWLHEYAFQMIAERVGKAGEDIFAFGFIWKGVGCTYNSQQKLYPAIWNKAWKRSFIGDTRFPDWRHSDDAGFARITHPYAKVEYWDMPLYYYNYMREGSLSWRIQQGEFDKK